METLGISHKQALTHRTLGASMKDDYKLKIFEKMPCVIIC